MRLLRAHEIDIVRDTDSHAEKARQRGRSSNVRNARSLTLSCHSGVMPDVSCGALTPWSVAYILSRDDLADILLAR